MNEGGGLPDTPLSAEAQRFLERIRPRIETGFAALEKTPVAVLVWGPGVESDHPLAPMRAQLRTVLRERGHLAMFSEELCDPNLPHSLRVQQLVQAQNFDLVVSLPATAGSIAEVHDFASHPRVNAKLLVFVNEEHIGGYSENSLRALATVLTCQLIYYPSVNETNLIEVVTLEQVQRIRELKFMYGWRLEA
jgi:hypothetical protein